MVNLRNDNLNHKYKKVSRMPELHWYLIQDWQTISYAAGSFVTGAVLAARDQTSPSQLYYDTFSLPLKPFQSEQVLTGECFNTSDNMRCKAGYVSIF